MKSIQLLKGDKYKSISFLRDVAGISPTKGMNVDELRKRVRIIKVLEKADADAADVCSLEDADHAVLVEAIKAYPLAVAHEQILAIIDAVLDAKPLEA